MTFTSHQSARLVVVQVDCCPGVVPTFQRVHEQFGDLLSERHVITAASPNPAPATWGVNNAHSVLTKTRV